LALASACAHPVQAEAPVEPRGDLSDAPHSLVAVHVDGVDVDWSAPWGTGKPWTRTLTGVVVDGHKILVAGWGLRRRRHIEVQKLGTAVRAAARAVLVDDGAGLALVTIDDPTFWSDLRPIAISVPSREGAGVKLLHVEADGSHAESSGGVVRRFVTGTVYDFLEMSINAADPKRVAISDVVSTGGQLCGLVMEVAGGDALAIPAPIAAGFLAEASRTPYRGYASLSVRWSSLSNVVLREELGLDREEGGVRIAKVWPRGSGYGALEDGDVLLSIGGTKINSDGTYAHPWAGRVPFYALLSEHRPGEALELGIVRHGERKTVSMPLKLYHNDDVLIPDVAPADGRSYAIEGGLVFEHLTQQYLRTLGKDWETKAPLHLLEAFELSRFAPSAERPRVVVLTRVLPAPSTLGYEHLRNLVVSEVNGTPIRTLDDVVAAFEHPAGGFHVVTFAPSQGVRRIVLDVQEAKNADARIRESYHLGADGADGAEQVAAPPSLPPAR
jgi:hypothetical protein